MKVIVLVGVFGFITLVVGAVVTGIGASEDCYGAYDWSWCDYQRTCALVSGISCLVTGGALL